MTIITNTYKTYESKGQQESVEDIIYNISPTDTPVLSMLERKGADATLEEWQTDSLGAAVSSNAQLEGDDYTSFPAVTPTVRVGNRMQIMSKLLIVSGTQQRVALYGRRDEVAYQLTLRGPELKRDTEKTILENIGADAGGAATARKMATLGAWVKTNVDKDAGGGNPTYTSGVPGAARTDGSTRAFNVTILKSVAQQVWVSGGILKYLFLGPVNKALASGFAGVATKNFDLSGEPRPHKIIGAADVYVSDFGTLNIVPTRFQRERDGWFIDPDMLAIKSLRPMFVDPVAKTGDAQKRALVQEITLQVKQEAGLGLAADLQTT